MKTKNKIYFIETIFFFFKYISRVKSISSRCLFTLSPISIRTQVPESIYNGAIIVEFAWIKRGSGKKLLTIDFFANEIRSSVNVNITVNNNLCGPMISATRVAKRFRAFFVTTT